MSKTIHFQPSLRLERGVDASLIKRTELRDSPNLWSFPIEEARRLARGAMGIALERMEADAEFQEFLLKTSRGEMNGYVDSWYTKTRTGQVPSPYGIHVDGSYKSKEGPGVKRNLEMLGKNAKSRLFLMTLGSSNGNADPLFISTPFNVDESLISEDRTFCDLHATVFPRIARGELSYLRPDPGTLCVYDGNTAHTAMPTRLYGRDNLERVLTRVSFLPHKYPHARLRERHSEVPIYYPNI